MTHGRDGETPRPYASSPCSLHEVDPAHSGVERDDPQARADVMRWRKAERKRLIAERFEIESSQRRAFAERIGARVEELLGEVRGVTLSAYWPIRGEPDLRALLERLSSRGAITSLPVVVEKRRPLAFRSWTPGDKLERGVWNIPVPAAGENVIPDIVIAAVVGFDAGCYRLGYGGGYYDRTLAARKPLVLGVGYSRAAIPTIYPQWHDIPMDRIVTEEGVVDPA